MNCHYCGTPLHDNEIFCRCFSDWRVDLSAGGYDLLPGRLAADGNSVCAHVWRGAGDDG